MSDAHPFERRWPDLADEYETLRDRAEAAVVHWQWAPPDSCLHRPEPLYAQRSELPQRGLLPAEPADKTHVLQYGYDADGRIVVARHHHHGSRQEDLYFPDGDRVESVRFAIHRLDALSSETYVAPEALREYRFDGRRIVGVQSYAGPNGWGSERYEYEGDRVVGIRCWADPPDPAADERWAATYDELGRLTTLREQVSGNVVYERSSEPAEELLRRVEKMLTAAIPAVVSGLWTGEPIACIGLGYDHMVRSPLPPLVGVCTAAEQAALFDEDLVEAWSPWAFPHVTGDPETAFASLAADPAAFAAASRALRATSDDDLLRDLVVGVADRLRRRGSWPAGLLSDDVVIFAVDGEMEDLERNLRRLLPRKRYVALDREGRIPVD